MVFLAACTQINEQFAHLLPEWVAYHTQHGFKNMYIYVNGGQRHWEHVDWLLRTFIAEGLVELIDWNFQAAQGFVHQQTQENSCIQRYRGQAQWVGLLDVDEYFQTVGLHQKATVEAWLQTQDEAKLLGGYQVESCFWGRSRDDSEQFRLDAASPISFGRYRYRASETEHNSREKCLVRPVNVDYFAVHTITAGKAMIRPKPFEEIRMAHFKLPAAWSYDTHDDSLQNWAVLVHQVLEGQTA